MSDDSDSSNEAMKSRSKTEMAQFINKLESNWSPAGFLVRRLSQELPSFHYKILPAGSVVVEATLLHWLVLR
jgi:hypothetical protein